MEHPADPTIVLVHGGFADGGGWAPVAGALLERGHRVRVPAVPLRGLNGDAAAVRSVVEQIPGPVLLAGHGYGGAVISVAGQAPNVRGLVFVAGFAPAAGESVTDLCDGFPEPEIVPALVRTGAELSIEADAFVETFADGIDPELARVLAVSQRPLATAALDEPAAGAAWPVTPAWGIVASAGQVISPDVERYGYQRAGIRHVVELTAPHLVMRSHPAEVTKVITDAVAELD